ncbi:putative quinol monooxygenase [Pseudolysobacter antarcticus]|nr:antibiotic biosynthesis monooxygenase [Pseudolysobacter antarcticus]
MPNKPVVLVNVLKVESKRQEALIALLKQNIDTVVRTLDGWKTSRLIAAADGATVVIYSEWETPAAFEAMRNDARMQACFAKILELANVDSIVGGIVLSESP